ncbi:hypothetical protein ACHAXT_002239 [Thalassiosira profunda]
MIRATQHMIHHARRPARRPLASVAASLSTRADAGPRPSGEDWPVNLALGAAAAASALGVGIAAQSYVDNHTPGLYYTSPSARAQCEAATDRRNIADVAAKAASSWKVEAAAEGEKETQFQTIPAGEILRDGTQFDAKSERAFAAAVENSLFNTYEDGADDWEEVEEADADDATVVAENGNVPTSNAVVEHFVTRGFSSSAMPNVNVKPRMSIRHTNRRARRDGENQEASPLDTPLATSDGSDSESSSDDKLDKDVILRRISTVRRNDLGLNQVYTKKMYFYQTAQIKKKMLDRFRLFALPSSKHLGKEMAYLLGTDLNCLNVGAFTDGETSVKIEDSIRGKEVFVVCTTTTSASLMELLLTISALRRGSAKRICAVLPYYGYSRQDRRTGMKREPIAAADVAVLLEEMGVDSVICVDLHNPLVKGFFSPQVPVDHLMPGPVAAAYFYEELFGVGDEDGDKKEEPKEPPKITVVAAHENQVFRANGFRNALMKLSGSDDIRVALVSHSKDLNVHGKVTTLVGDTEGRKCIIVDDIINTGGTMRKAIEVVNQSGASDIYAWATHGVLHLPENEAPEKIQQMDCLNYLLISNSVAVERELPSKIRKLSIAPLLAESVARALHCESIRSILTAGEIHTPSSRK